MLVVVSTQRVPASTGGKYIKKLNTTKVVSRNWTAILAHWGCRHSWRPL